MVATWVVALRGVGGLAYADNITLLAPCNSALSVLISVCEDYAAEYDIIFNGSKSKLLYFKGRSSAIVPSVVLVNGEIVAISDKTVHLRHTTCICTKYLTKEHILQYDIIYV